MLRACPNDTLLIRFGIRHGNGETGFGFCCVTRSFVAVKMQCMDLPSRSHKETSVFPVVKSELDLTKHQKKTMYVCKWSVRERRAWNNPASLHDTRH